MAKFPEPPPAADLAEIPAAVHILPRGTLLWRIYFQGGRHPTFWNRFRSWGPTHSRFDHHEPPAHDQDRSILYAAGEGPTCLAEVFQDTRVIQRTRANPWLAGFGLARDVTLLDLTGPWPTRVGASMALSTGPRPRSRRWSRRIHAAYPDVDGVLYPSSMAANRPSAALCERAEDALPAHPEINRRLDDPAFHFMLCNVASRLGYGLL